MGTLSCQPLSSNTQVAKHQGTTFSKACEVPAHLHDAHHDSRRPIFHPQAERGWSSDPCGPVYYKGRYHLFYQHLQHSCQWFWGLCWDHLVSDDLVHWQHLPPAVVPTPGWLDADGCFSGTVEVDPELGVPVIMYTGVYLKTNQTCVKAHGLPPPEHDPGTRFVERQLAAVPADPDDPDLTHWLKLPDPVIYPAPAGLNISCWRDPFCAQRPAAAGGEGDEWVILLASGIRGVGGAVLRFRSKHWTYGWEFDGLLAHGDNTVLGIKGQDWECPILTKLPAMATPPSLANLPALPASHASTVAVTADEVQSTGTNSSNENHGSYVALQEDQQQQRQRQDDQVALVAAGCTGGSGSSSSSASSVLIELANVPAPAAAAAAAAETGPCLLGLSVSQQLLLPKGKAFKSSARVGSSSSLISAAHSHDASTGSLLAVGHYPTNGCTTVCESRAASTGFGSSEYHPDQMSEVSSSIQINSSFYQHDAKRFGSNVGLSCSRSEDSFNTGDAYSMSQVPAERLASAAAADYVIGSGGGRGSSAATVVPLFAAADAAALIAAAAGGTVAPLTEPVLEAVQMSAAAEGESSALTEQHPSTNISVWLEQSSGSPAVPAAAAAAEASEFTGAAALSNAAPVAAAAAAADDEDGDLIIVIDSAADPVKPESGINGDAIMLQQQQQQQVADDVIGSNSSSSGSIACTDVMKVPFPSSSNSSSSRYAGDWWFCMSPDACNNPITWWLGHYNGRRFDIAAANGPHRLDLGTTLYAASLWVDPQGRQLLYGWMQEHRRVPSPPSNCLDFSYAGCISTPRVLQLVGGRLFQQPLPEIDRLRTQVSWHAADFPLSPGGPLKPLQVVSGTHLDINLTLQPPAPAAAAAADSASAMGTCCAAPAPDSVAECAGSSSTEAPQAGLVFKSWRMGGCGAAVLSFDWSTHCLVFDFDEPFPDAYTPHPADSPEQRRVGGRLMNYEPGTPLSLRVLVDGSAVEVFTSTGEALTTRMYRGHPPKCRCQHCNPSSSSSSGSVVATQQQQEQLDGSHPTALEDETGIALFAAGSAVQVTRLDVWEMGSCWVNPPTLADKQQQQQGVEYLAGEPDVAIALTNPSKAAESTTTAAGWNTASKCGTCLLRGTAAAAGQTVHAAGQTVHAAGQTVHAAGQTVHATGQTAHAAGQSAHAAGQTVSNTPGNTPAAAPAVEIALGYSQLQEAVVGSAAAAAVGNESAAYIVDSEKFAACNGSSSSNVGSTVAGSTVTSSTVTGSTRPHQPAGTQAQVADDFLEDLHIHTTGVGASSSSSNMA